MLLFYFTIFFSHLHANLNMLVLLRAWLKKVRDTSFISTGTRTSTRSLCYFTVIPLYNHLHFTVIALSCHLHFNVLALYNQLYFTVIPLSCISLLYQCHDHLYFRHHTIVSYLIYLLIKGAAMCISITYVELVVVFNSSNGTA